MNDIAFTYLFGLFMRIEREIRGHVEGQIILVSYPTRFGHVFFVDERIFLFAVHAIKTPPCLFNENSGRQRHVC